MKNSEDPEEILHKRHFIRIDTVFYDKLDLQSKKYNFFYDIPQYMKWTVRTDSNFMDHSIDLKRLKSNVHMLYLCLYKLVLIAHAKMLLINAHVNVSDVFNEVL